MLARCYHIGKGAGSSIQFISDGGTIYFPCKNIALAALRQQETHNQMTGTQKALY